MKYIAYNTYDYKGLLYRGVYVLDSFNGDWPPIDIIPMIEWED